MLAATVLLHARGQYLHHHVRPRQVLLNQPIVSHLARRQRTLRRTPPTWRLSSLKPSSLINSVNGASQQRPSHSFDHFRFVHKLSTPTRPMQYSGELQQCLLDRPHCPRWQPTAPSLRHHHACPRRQQPLLILLRCTLFSLRHSADPLPCKCDPTRHLFSVPFALQSRSHQHHHSYPALV